MATSYSAGQGQLTGKMAFAFHGHMLIVPALTGRTGAHKKYDFQISNLKQQPDESPTEKEAVQEGILS